MYFCRVKNNNKYEAVIGLEVHAQLLTKSKLFCGDGTTFGAVPNTQVSPVSLAHPGTLPVMNEQVIEHAVKLGLALNCQINQKNYFARKNYFYPDLPKGYQVSQHTTPICKGGYLTLQSIEGEKIVELNRIHIEEDAGKSIHNIDENYTCIDLNRAGMPLLEIVTEPGLRSADDAYTFITELRKLVRWLGVCDGNMEEGSMRCDANISIRLKGETKLNTRVEVKNLNSIRNVKKAIEVEIERLIELTENDQPIVQQTRSFDADTNTTFALRNKEEADDYRYFPEPDLPPFYLSQKYIQVVRDTIPVLPAELQKKYIAQYKLSPYDAAVICNDKEDADFFEQLVQHTSNYKAAANWMIGPLKSYCHEHSCGFSTFPLESAAVGGLIQLTAAGLINFKNASGKILQAMIAAPATTALQIATELNLLQESGAGIVETWVEKVIDSLPQKVKEYKSGKKNLLGLFAGEVKKISNGKADMQLVNKLLAEKLNN